MSMNICKVYKSTLFRAIPGCLFSTSQSSLKSLSFSVASYSSANFSQDNTRESFRAFHFLKIDIDIDRWYQDRNILNSLIVTSIRGEKVAGKVFGEINEGLYVTLSLLLTTIPFTVVVMKECFRSLLHKGWNFEQHFFWVEHIIQK